MYMKRHFISLALGAICLTAMAATGKTKVYMYGFAEVIGDSTVYITEIQEVDSAYTNSKDKFLYGRSEYSAQLRSYLHQQGVERPTCVTSYAVSRKKIDKKMAALRKRCNGKMKRYIKTIKTEDFAYKAVVPEVQHP